MNCLISMEGATKRDWIQASRILWRFADQTTLGLGHTCYVNCPMGFGLQDFWGPLQYYGGDNDIPVTVKREEVRAAYPKHSIVHGYEQFFLKRAQAIWPVGEWRFFEEDEAYLHRLRDQRARKSFQWKPGYVAWVPPIQQNMRMPGRPFFWKSFMTYLAVENRYPIEQLAIGSGDYWDRETELPLEPIPSVKMAYCPSLDDLAYWFLNASYVICEEGWLADLAACLAVASFVVGPHNYEENTAYHYPFDYFPLRYYLPSASMPLELNYALSEFSKFQSIFSSLR